VPYYTKFENILPEELIHSEITGELQKAKKEIKNIIEEDLENIKKLADSQNKRLAFNEFRKPASIIRIAFYIENDPLPTDQV
jgi:hypothetical protein